MRVAHQFVTERDAAKNDAKLLDMRFGGPILTFTPTTYDHSGQIVKIRHTHYHPQSIHNRI